MPLTIVLPEASASPTWDEGETPGPMQIEAPPRAVCECVDRGAPETGRGACRDHRMPSCTVPGCESQQVMVHVRPALPCPVRGPSLGP